MKLGILEAKFFVQLKKCLLHHQKKKKKALREKKNNQKNNQKTKPKPFQLEISHVGVSVCSSKTQ